MRRVAIIEPLRIASERVPRKVLERVGGVRLLDRGLAILSQLQQTGLPVLVAAWEGDAEIVEAARAAGLEWFPLGEANVRAEDWLGIYSGFAALESRFDWCVVTHAVCHPFVRAETLAQAAQRAAVAEWPFHIATAERTVAWARGADGETRAILTAPMLNSKTCDELIRPSHLGGGYSLADCLETARVLTAEPFVPVGVRPVELLDVDTFEQLEFLRLVADGMRWQEQLKDRQTAAPDLWAGSVLVAPEYGA